MNRGGLWFMSRHMDYREKPCMFFPSQPLIFLSYYYYYYIIIIMVGERECFEINQGGNLEKRCDEWLVK